MTGLLAAAYLPNADTDTLASTTGSLLGALHGAGWLGRLAAVQDAEYISRLSNDLAEPGSELAAASPVSERHLTNFKRRLIESGLNDRLPFVDGRQIWIRGRHSLEGRASLSRYVAESHDGQHLVIDLKLPRETKVSEGGPATAHREDGGSQPPRVGAILPTGNTRAVAAFYANLLNAPVEQVGGLVRVSRWLAFREADASPTSAEEIVIVSDDLNRAAEGHIAEWGYDSDGRQFFRLTDPDGRPVRVVPRADP